MHYQAHGRRLDCLECVLGPDLERQLIVQCPLPGGERIVVIRDNPRNHTYSVSVGTPRSGARHWVHRQVDILPALRDELRDIPGIEHWTAEALGLPRTKHRCLDARRSEGWGPVA